MSFDDFVVLFCFTLVVAFFSGLFAIGMVFGLFILVILIFIGVIIVLGKAEKKPFLGVCAALLLLVLTAIVGSILYRSGDLTMDMLFPFLKA